MSSLSFLHLYTPFLIVYPDAARKTTTIIITITGSGNVVFINTPIVVPNSVIGIKIVAIL